MSKTKNTVMVMGLFILSKLYFMSGEPITGSIFVFLAVAFWVKESIID